MEVIWEDSWLTNPDKMLKTIMLMRDTNEDVSWSTVPSFADDTNICKATQSNKVNWSQEDLNNIYNWANKNNMEINDEIFEWSRCGTLQDLLENTAFHMW